MRTTLGPILLFIISACSNPIQEDNQISIAEESASVTTDSLDHDNILDTASENTESEDCVFDQATQTDEFLKDVKELKGYRWNNASRSATYVLESGDTLLITRGGCHHFTVSAEFRLKKDRTDYSKWNNVYQKVLWIAKALDNEFDYEELKKDIDLEKVTIEDYGYADVASFDNEILVDNGYTIERTLHPGSTTIRLSKTLN